MPGISDKPVTDKRTEIPCLLGKLAGEWECNTFLWVTCKWGGGLWLRKADEFSLFLLSCAIGLGFWKNVQQKEE